MNDIHTELLTLPLPMTTEEAFNFLEEITTGLLQEVAPSLASGGRKINTKVAVKSNGLAATISVDLDIPEGQPYAGSYRQLHLTQHDDNADRWDVGISLQLNSVLDQYDCILLPTVKAGTDEALTDYLHLKVQFQAPDRSQTTVDDYVPIFVSKAVAFKLGELYPQIAFEDLPTIVNTVHEGMKSGGDLKAAVDSLAPYKLDEPDRLYNVIEDIAGSIAAALSGLGADVVDSDAIGRIIWNIRK